MNNINAFLSKLCPNGVEYKTLGELGSFLGGLSGKSKNDFKNGNSKFISYVNVFNNIQVDIDVTDTVKIGENERQNLIQYGDVLFTGSSETQNECGMSSVLTIKTEEKLYLNSFCFIYRFNNPELFIPAFTKYLFRSDSLRKQIIKTASGVTRYNVSKAKMAKVKLPIPPLEVQNEIANRLDRFTELTSKLTAKLTSEFSLRQKQYNYYRDNLLSFNNTKCEWKTIEEIATDIFRGSGIKRDEITATGIPCVRYGEIYTQYNTYFKECISHTNLEYVQSPKYFGYGDVLFAITGESVEDIAKSVVYLGDKECLAGGDIVVLKHNQNPRYMAHVLLTANARAQKSKGKIKSKVVHSNVPSIKSIIIPLPSLEIQAKIADILDKYEILCNDLLLNISVEIEARRKQYEYYRDKLLSFKEL